MRSTAYWSRYHVKRIAAAFAFLDKAAWDHARTLIARQQATFGTRVRTRSFGVDSEDLRGGYSVG